MKCPSCGKNEGSENFEIIVNHEKVFCCSKDCFNLFLERLRMKGISYTSKTLGDFPIEIEFIEGAEEDVN